jgi:2,3-bisphosphoglycerate-dependent phosphoglycerate mutase
MRQRGANRPHVAHDVQLPVRVPLSVIHVLEAGLTGNSSVVHEHIESAKRRHGLRDYALRIAGKSEIAHDVKRLPHAGSVSPPTGRNASSLRDKLPRDLAANPSRRTGDEAAAIVEAEVHGSSSVSPMTRIILARHGETDWNRNGIWQGHGDPPLNDLGRQQAAALAERLSDVEIDVLYSSDLRRALETAEIVGGLIELVVRTDAGLREMDVGSWTGLTRAQIEERFPGMTYHDGESRDAFDRRVVSTLHRVAASHDGVVVAVTHGGVVRALQRRVLSEPLPVLANCEIDTFRYEGGAFTRID